MSFLPTTAEEMRARGWDEADFVFVTGDAYVDHSSFGTAIISRVLESRGYKVAILAQPDWRSADDFKRFGRPRLGFLVNSGNVDSMVNHFSVNKKRRREDVYSPGGVAGKRPDRALIVYCQRIREAYKDVPVLIGGLHASLRRLAHYDYWDDKMRRSILLDAKADLLMYGMGERSVVEIADALASGLSVRDVTWIPGTCWRATNVTEAELPELLGPDGVVLPPWSAVQSDKAAYAESFRLQYYNNDSISGKPLAEFYETVPAKTDADGNETPARGIAVIQNIPQPPLEPLELDDVYELPYEGTYHPSYEKDGGVPAIREVEFSITANRGCFGGCAFCALTYHQGRAVRGRSLESVVREAKKLTEKPNFKGYIHDIGGPTANFHNPACEKQKKLGVCRDRDCLWPAPCKNMKVDHKDYLAILRAVRGLPKVKKVFVRSGIRFDYLMADPDRTFFRELCEHHISGTLKVAPEHIAPPVLACMRKAPVKVFDAFTKEYKKINEELGKDQYLIPYLISSHPGATLEDAVTVAEYLHKTGFVPDQVQDFYPTPGTLATCMYYTGVDPLTGKKVYVEKDLHRKHLQRALLHFNKPENRALVLEALHETGREDLIPELLGGKPNGTHSKTAKRHNTRNGDR
ncbi:MAG: YgiQ family radical SAM protein [Firmicutes bacterium]|nr:YgiQ family radical SAM protein [Bacillota bacterium]